MEGWIKLHRKVLFSDMYRSLNSKQRDVMTTCLLLANHSENEWEFSGDIYKCKPGQFITSLQKIADFCGNDVKVQSVRTALLKLEKWGFLTNKSTKQNRLITICKWDTYQKKEDGSNKDANSQPTNDQQTSNKQLTTNKNEEEFKEGKEEMDFPEGKRLNEFPNQDSDKVQKATKSVADFFNISEINHSGHYMKIGNFCRYIEKTDKFEYFRKQFIAYCKLKDNSSYRHSWFNYIGSPEKMYEDGAWNLKDWESERKNASKETNGNVGYSITKKMKADRDKIEKENREFQKIKDGKQ